MSEEQEPSIRKEDVTEDGGAEKGGAEGSVTEACSPAGPASGLIKACLSRFSSASVPWRGTTAF